MKNNLYRVLSLVLTVFFLNTLIVAQITRNEDAEIAEKVRTAFERAAKYEYPSIGLLKPYGKKIIPYLQPYLTSTDLGIRHLTMSLIEDVQDPEYIPLLIIALRDSDAVISREASIALYDNFDHKLLGQNAEVGKALRDSLKNENKSLSSIVLLGYFPEPETEKTLLSVNDKKDFYFWSGKIEFESEISLTVPVYLSLYRIDKAKYYGDLSNLVKKASSGEIQFLLYAIKFIDDSVLLKSVFEKGIGDRKILESENGVEGKPLPNSLRISDLTVNKFARKLNLDLGFELQETRYSPKKISIARQKITAALSSL